MFVNTLTLNEAAYPNRLLSMDSAPTTLFYMGDIKRLESMPSVAVVGSRKTTAYGRDVTLKLVRELAAKGIAIVSGLALGVDGMAHQAALECGAYTVAVLPAGLDRIYPSSHTQLAKRIVASGGAIVSEYQGNVEPRKYTFIARNRIIAGLADAVLVTEAGARSGTLHTANFALEQGKTVLAVPGNITSPQSFGTNNLIKAGAAIATEARDILDALGIPATSNTRLPLAANVEEAAILAVMSQGVTDLVSIHKNSSLDIKVFNQTMTMLELNGIIRPLGAGHYALQ